MSNKLPPLPDKDHFGDINVFQLVSLFFRTRILAQILLIGAVLIGFYVLFHHYLPSYNDMWYGLRPSDKELIFDTSEDMSFVDVKTGKFLIWYETRPNGYRFYNQPGFYGAGKERELADTEEEIQCLKNWVEQNAAKKKQAEEIKSNNEDKAALQEKLIATLREENAKLNSEVEKLKQPPQAVTIAAPNNPPEIKQPDVEISNDPAYYRYGEIIPPNPKPLAWFQSLKWGRLPPAPYMYNAGNGFFEIPGKPESRIAPHPHFVIKNNRTGVMDRPYVFFSKIHGAVPQEVKFPPLDDDYYRAVKNGLDANFSFKYPYKVTLGGVEY